MTAFLSLCSLQQKHNYVFFLKISNTHTHTLTEALCGMTMRYYPALCELCCVKMFTAVLLKVVFLSSSSVCTCISARFTGGLSLYCICSLSEQYYLIRIQFLFKLALLLSNLLFKHLQTCSLTHWYYCCPRSWKTWISMCTFHFTQWIFKCVGKMILLLILLTHLVLLKKFKTAKCRVFIGKQEYANADHTQNGITDFDHDKLKGR